MNIFLLLAMAMVLILVLLKKHVPIGPTMLIAGLFVWAIRSLDVGALSGAFLNTFSKSRTYDIIAALYFVMCLEIELRTSGSLHGMVTALQRLFSSPKVTLAVMPAFLGLLPSLGGARFSCPIVSEASENVSMTDAHKAAVNFFFRHIFEFSNPIIPGMILACSIVGVPYSAYIAHLAWVTPLAFVLGWVILIRPLKVNNVVQKVISEEERRQNIQDVVFALSPVVITFILVVFFKFNASIGMGVVTAGLFVILQLFKRSVNFKEVVVGALDYKMFSNVLLILYFIQILTDTRVLMEIVEAFKTSPLPVPVVIAIVSFVIGLLTGMSQGHVAIVMPVVAAMMPGSLNLAGIAMVFGMAGQMLTPTHMCLIVTMDYFKANIFSTLKPILLVEILITAIFSVYTYMTW